MTFILDTNILSNAQTPRPDASIRSWLLVQEKVAIPFPVILEIEQGICEVRKTNPGKAARLSHWLAEIFTTDYLYPAITPEVASRLAELNCCGPLKQLWYTEVRHPKAKKPGQDLLIAAIAIVHDLPIATLDVHDFALIDRFYALPGVYDPSRDAWAVERNRPMNESSARSCAVDVSEGDPSICDLSLSA
ncbi:hypothetical protein C8J31_11461 [Rhizobium sp. PP-CC-2G-626]|nr:hypothetical protein C8J31_11461 [Rhizobium sp. PP-CC-2G-626]